MKNITFVRSMAAGSGSGCSRILTLAAVCASAGLAVAAPITPGNLVVLRFGDGSAVLPNAATPVFIEEFTTAGVAVQTIPVPSSGAGALTATGSATTEGILTRSQDGSRLVFAGYRKDAGSSGSPSADAPATTNRVIATLTVDGTLDTSIDLVDTTGAIRSANTASGSNYYVGTSVSVRHVPVPGPDATSVLIDTRNSRQVLLSGNVLYASNGSTSITNKVQHYGTLPAAVTVPTGVVALATPDAINGFWMADLDLTLPGDDTIYVASTAENLLRKYSWDGTTWLLNGSVSATGLQNVTGSVNGSTVTLYLASTAANGGIFTLTDASGHMGTLAGPLSAAIVNAGTNRAFRGISMFPGGAAPEYLFAGMAFAPAEVALTWTGSPGAPPKIEVSTDLSVWGPLGTATEPNAGTYQISDVLPDGSTRRFYRLVP